MKRSEKFEDVTVWLVIALGLVVLLLLMLQSA